MSLKAVRDQNDISIIIGNLPKRLQMKIAEDCYGANNVKKLTTKTTTTTRNTPVVKTKASTSSNLRCDSMEKETPNDDMRFNDVEPILVPKGNFVKDVVVNGGEVKEIIPGILRLQPSEPTKIGKTTEEVRTKSRVKNLEVAALSPARQLSKVAAMLPSWCALNNTPSCIRELPQLHATLIDFMKHNTVLQNWKKFNEVRQKLQQLFFKLLLQNLKFCCEQKVDTFFWKLLFYNVREHLKEQTPEELVQEYLLIVFKEGLEFYENLHEELTAKYFVITHNNSRQNSADKYEFIAKVMAQKLLICLGDLCRYKAKQLQSSDFSEAGSYYQRAQYLIPSNGIPYNQLAIVAIQSRKKFDAIYYHMRSLMSSNAIHSARESLLVLFDEIRKKYEDSEMRKSPTHLNYQRHNYQKNNHKTQANDKNNNNQHDNVKTSLRKEMWLHANGNKNMAYHCNDFRSSSNNNINNNSAKYDYFKDMKNEQLKYDQMNQEELIPLFMHLYLNVIGKLYTGIGMETIAEHQNKLCLQFHSILQRESLMPLEARKRLLKILALNIFILEHNKSHETRRYHAFLLTNQMFGLLLHQCNHSLLVNNFLDETSNKDFQNLSILLKYTHLYTVWLSRNLNIWEPLRKFDTDYNCWQELDKLFEHIRHALTLKNGQIDIYARASLILDEEFFLAGFTPLFDQKDRASIPLKNENSVATEVAQFYARLLKISSFQLAYNENCHKLQLEKLPQEREFEEIKFILQTMSRQAQHNGFKKSKSATELLNAKTETEVKSKSIISQDDTKVKDDEMLQLSKLKRELEAKTNIKSLYSAQLEEILNYVDTKLYIEIRPKYLMPDTNCFIDSIDDFESLIENFKCYTLIIPLTVVKELDGLSKGFKIDSYEQSLAKDRIHHYDDVSTRAKKSLEFIKSAKNQVKCATTKGSIINASLFALVEEEYVSNDDKILATALALSKNFSTENSAGGRCFIQTELVLITTDRNLRVKALTRKLAVSDFSEFMEWNSNNKYSGTY